VVWRNGKDTLLDGHHRLEICRRNGIKFAIKPIEMASRAHARVWIRFNQLGRRNLSDDQRAAIAMRTYKETAALSRKDQLAHARDVKTGKVSVEANGATTESKPRTRTEVAREAKIPATPHAAAAGQG
jgi:hypothetical protein